MDGLGTIGRLIIFIGIGLVVLGVLFLLIGRIPGLGRLPGDIAWRRGSFTFYAPLATSLLLSLILTIMLSLLFRRR